MRGTLRRRVERTCRWVCAAICALSVAVWAISGWYWAWTEISIGGQRFGVRVSQGVVWLEYSSVPLPAAWGEPTKHYLGPAQAAGFPRWRWGFYASVARYPSGGETSTLVVPLWFVALLAAAP